jgi:serine protease Do
MKKIVVFIMILSLCSLGLYAKKNRPRKGSVKFGSTKRLSTDIVKAKKTSKAFIDVAKFVKPCVVSVSSSKILKTQFNQFYGLPFEFFFGQPYRDRGQKPPEREYRQEGLGSGVIVSITGYILTNSHVVAEADEITVTLMGNREVEAEVVGMDKLADIAVLKLKEDISDLPVASLGNSNDVEVGEWVLAIGNPFSKKLSHTVTAGIVSAKGRNAGINVYENFIQTDASINPGNSGGALVNLRGEVIGINTAIMSRSGGNIGIGFAIPINMAKKVMEDLIYHGKVSRGWLGIKMQPLEKNLGEALGLEDNNGVLFQDVLKNTPAEKAGIKSGDVIIGVDDVQIKTTEELQNLIGNTSPGTKVKIKIIRNKKEKIFKVKLDERTADVTGEESIISKEDLIGIKVRNLTPGLAQQYKLDSDDKGALIVSVKPRSSAASADLRTGDLIQRIDQDEIENVSDYKKTVKGVKVGKSLLFYIKRGDINLYVGIKIKKKEN